MITHLRVCCHGNQNQRVPPVSTIEKKILQTYQNQFVTWLYLLIEGYEIHNFLANIKVKIKGTS